MLLPTVIHFLLRALPYQGFYIIPADEDGERFLVEAWQGNCICKSSESLIPWESKYPRDSFSEVLRQERAKVKQAGLTSQWQDFAVVPGGQ